MSEYIINPSWFYWASVIHALRVTLLVVGIVGSLLTGVVTAVAAGDFEWDELKKHKLYWVCLIVSVLMLVCGIFAPSKEVMMQMMVARFLTHENIAYSVETIKEIADYILQAVGK